MAARRAHNWDAELADVVNPAVTYPDYYTQPFHAYKEVSKQPLWRIACITSALHSSGVLRLPHLLCPLMPAAGAQACFARSTTTTACRLSGEPVLGLGLGGDNGGAVGARRRNGPRK